MNMVTKALDCLHANAKISEAESKAWEDLIREFSF